MPTSQRIPCCSVTEDAQGYAEKKGFVLFLFRPAENSNVRFLVIAAASNDLARRKVQSGFSQGQNSTFLAGRSHI